MAAARPMPALDRLTEMMRSDTSLIFSDPERYFQRLERMGNSIPVIRGDLQHHASGLLRHRFAGKEANRRAEAELTDAEKIDVGGPSAASAALPGPGAEPRLEKPAL